MAPATNPAHAGQRTGATMRAIVQGTYGSADALRPDDVDRPRGGPQDVLLRVRAAGADTGVWHVMAGRPYLMRVMGFDFRGTRS